MEPSSFPPPRSLPKLALGPWAVGLGLGVILCCNWITKRIDPSYRPAQSNGNYTREEQWDKDSFRDTRNYVRFVGLVFIGLGTLERLRRPVAQSTDNDERYASPRPADSP